MGLWSPSGQQLDVILGTGDSVKQVYSLGGSIFIPGKAHLQTGQALMCRLVIIVVGTWDNFCNLGMFSFLSMCLSQNYYKMQRAPKFPQGHRTAMCESDP